jgi:hypothetical protein
MAMTRLQTCAEFFPLGIRLIGEDKKKLKKSQKNLEI